MFVCQSPQSSGRYSLRCSDK